MQHDRSHRITKQLRIQVSRRKRNQSVRALEVRKHSGSLASIWAKSGLWAAMCNAHPETREAAVDSPDLATGETRVLTQVDGQRANSVRAWTRIAVCFFCGLMVRNSAFLRAEEWQSYGGNRSNWKYSALQQIDAKNVSRLQIA